MKQHQKKTELKAPSKRRKKVSASRILFLVVIGMITIGLVGSSFMVLL